MLSAPWRARCEPRCAALGRNELWSGMSRNALKQRREKPCLPLFPAERIALLWPGYWPRMRARRARRWY